MVVEKRDGRTQKFTRDKIIEAMRKAYAAEHEEVDDEFVQFSDQVAENIEKLVYDSYNLKSHKVLSVEDIQDIIEKKLMASKYKDVAKHYILYRDKRTQAREFNTNFMKEVTRKLEADEVDNQNANIDEHSFGGRKGEAEDVLMKKYALDFLVSELARKKHINNEIYIHDLNNYAVGSHNCLSIPFDDLLSKGFKVKQTDMRPVRSIGSALQVAAVIFQLQSLDQFGGCSATHIDWTMVPYVRLSFYKHYRDGLEHIDGLTPQQIDNELKSKKKPEDISIDDTSYYYYEKAYNYAMKMTQKETKQAVEAMYHNLNSLQSRSGNQLPFTSINYGTCTKTEGRMVTRTLLEVAIEGLGKYHRTSIFPCAIFQCMKGVNRKEGDPNYDLFQLALKSTALRLYPNYCNCDVSTQQEWIMYDRKQKEEYINSLSEEEYKTLIKRLEDNPELQSILMLEVVEE